MLHFDLFMVCRARTEAIVILDGINMSPVFVVPWSISVDTATLSAVVISAMAKPKHPLDAFTQRRGMSRAMVKEAMAMMVARILRHIVVGLMVMLPAP